MAISKNIRGTLFAFLGGIGWGFSGACAQLLFRDYQLDPLWLSSIRMLCAGLVLVAFALIIRRKPLLQLWKSPRYMLWLLVFTVAGLAFCQITYLLAIEHSNAGTATVLQYIGPVMIVFFLCFKGHRKPTLKEVAAMVLVVSGTFLLATHGNPANMVLSPLGLFWGITSAFALMLYTLIPGGLMLRFGNIPVVASGLLLGGILLTLALQSWTVDPHMELSGYVVMFVGLVFFGTILGFSFYFQAVSDIGAAKTSLIASIETVSATLFAVLWLGTSFSWIDIVGFVFIMATVFLLAKPTKTIEEIQEEQASQENNEAARVSIQKVDEA